MKNVAVMGCTGSIGRTALAVVRNHPDRFRITAIAARRESEEFASVAHEFRPSFAALSEGSADFKKRLPNGTEYVFGKDALLACAAADYDVLLAAVVGFAGLEGVLAAAERGKTIALANKESLVAGGALVTGAAKRSGARILPVDSEHSALWQALSCRYDTPFEKLILTASGGPFLRYSADALTRVTAKEALRHPNWNMGAKITVDSATLFNKGLEVIEATWLFGVPEERVEVVVHPQSVVHSMVEFADGAVIAQLGYPSMEVPVQLALSYPERISSSVPRLDFAELHKLEFERPDEERFPCLRLARQALRAGGSYPATANAANEAAVNALLSGKIGLCDIPSLIESALGAFDGKEATDFAQLAEIDEAARRYVIRKIGD